MHMSHISHYRVLPWTMGPLTSLESTVKVPDRKSLQRANRLSSDFPLGGGGGAVPDYKYRHNKPESEFLIGQAEYL